METTSAPPPPPLIIIRRLCGILGKAALCLMLFLMAGETIAQTTTLVSNTSLPSESFGANSRFATKFTTGANSTGYTISSVSLALSTVPGTLTVSIRDGSGTDPGTVVATLSNPDALAANSVNTFTAPKNTMLAASTTYFLVAEPKGSTGVDVIGTYTETGETGWSIANESRWGDDSYTKTNAILRFSINGQAGIAPPAPTGFTVTSGNAQVALNWADPSNSDITKYQFRQGTGTTITWDSWTDITNSDATTTTHTITGLTNGTEYSFQVRAVAGSLDGTESSTVTATPMVPPVVSIARQGNAAVTEGADVIFRVTASRTVTTDLKVNLSVAEAAGSDFIASNNKGMKMVMIPASSGSVTYTVATEDDNMDESNGSVTVTVANGTGYTVGSPSSAMVIINDDDATPSITSLATANVAEGTTDVLTVMANDPDAGAVIRYSISGGADRGLFTIGETSGALTFTTAPDFEGASADGDDNYEVIVTASDGENSVMQTITVTVTDMNEPPVIAPQTFSVTENTAAGTTVGTVAATDEDAGDNLTYSVTAGNVGNAFVINENTGVITVAGTIDHETIPAYTLTVQVSDGDLSASAAVTINVTNINDNSPMITSPATASVVENTTAVLTVMADDADAGTTLTYAISAGADSVRFSLNQDTRALAFKTAPDFETPSDQGGDNDYEVIVTVSDGTNNAMQTITVTVTDVNEPPVINSEATASVVEGTTTVLTVTATDADAGTTLMYSISGGADAALFTINANSGALTFITAPDFEGSSADGDDDYEVEVTVSDGTNSVTQIITITVTNDPADDILGLPEAEGIRLYPNPAADHFTLTGTSGLLRRVALISTAGKLVRTYSASKNGAYNTSGLSEGIFFVIMESNEGRRYAGRIVIRRQ